MIWSVTLGPADLPVFAPHKGDARKPRMPTKNTYLVTVPTRGKRDRIVSKSEIKDQLANAFYRLGGAPFIRHRVSLHLVQYAPRRHATGPLAGEPLLDSDACLFAVRDALEHAGVVVDDVFLNPSTCESVYRKGEPGLAIEIRELADV